MFCLKQAREDKRRGSYKRSLVVTGAGVVTMIILQEIGYGLDGNLGRLMQHTWRLHNNVWLFKL